MEVHPVLLGSWSWDVITGVNSLRGDCGGSGGELDGHGDQECNNSL